MDGAVCDENEFVCIKEAFLVYPVVSDAGEGDVSDAEAACPYLFVVAQSVRNDYHDAFFLLLIVFSIEKCSVIDYNYSVRRVKCQ